MPFLDRPTKSLLVIDREPAIGAAVRRQLRDFTVIVATSANDALERLARGETFDVILCDVEPPGMSGFELVERIRASAPAILERAIFTTAGTTSDGVRDFVATVSNRVLQKPFNRRKLREAVDAILRA